MMRLIRSLLTFGIILLSTSACNSHSSLDNSSKDNGTNGDSTSTNNENEVKQSEFLLLPLALSQNIIPKNPTLTLLVETSSEQEPQSVVAQYDEPSTNWVADIKVQPGSTTEFILTWSDKVRDQSLTLAQATKVIAIPLNAKRLDLDIPDDEYNLSFDADADGLSNLTETTNSTNPFDSSNPGEGLVRVEVNLIFDLPGNPANSTSTTTITPTAFLNGKELTLSFNSDNDQHAKPVSRVDKHIPPVSDAEFDTVLEKFGALSHAIENKDADALDRLATSSEQSDLFKHLINNNYDRIDVSIRDIRLRNFDKSITGTLQIDSLVQPNGDRSSLSEKYTSRTITSRKVDGDWTKIEW